MPTIPEIHAEIDAQLPTNAVGQISASRVRTVLHDITDQLGAGSGGTFTGTGDPGLTRANHIGVTYSTPPNVIRTTGYSTPGDYGGGMYIKVSSQPNHSGWFQTADGSYYELFPNGGEIWVEQFGTLKGATYDDITRDASVGINTAIDYINFNRFGICDLRLGPGTFYLANTVQLKGNTFRVTGMGTGFTGYGTGEAKTGTYVRPGKRTDGFVGHYNQSFEKTSSGYFANGVYEAGDKVYMWNTDNDNSYICRVGGTAGAASEPTGTGTGIIDGTITWDFYRKTSRTERMNGAWSGTISGIYMDSHWYRWGGPTTDPWPYDTSTGADYGGYCGIFMRSRGDVVDCFTTNFSGCGIVYSANGGVTYYKSTGNCNHLRVSKCGSYWNGLDGLHISGADANGGAAEMCDFSANGRWAVAEYSFLGNKHTAHESAYDGEASASFFDGYSPNHYVTHAGRYWAARIPLLGIINSYDYSQEPGTSESWVDIGQAYTGASLGRPEWVNTGWYEAGGTFGTINANSRNKWDGCYVEGSSAFSQFGRFDFVDGNLLSNIVQDRCMNIRNDNSQTGTGNFQNLRGAINGYGNPWTVHVGGFGNLTADWRGRNLLMLETDAYDFYSLAGNSNDIGIGSIGWSRNGSAYAASYLMTLDYTTLKFGRANAVGFGKHAFGQIFIGDGDAHNAKAITGFTGALPPADGREVGRGEIFFRLDATPGAVAMVQCTTAGLAGGTAVFKTMSTLAS